MKALINSSILLLLSMSNFSCNDIIERNLSNQNISIETPSDEYTSSSYTVLFRWESMRGALQYRIQIARPDFTNLQSLVLDTVISNKENQAYITFFPGNYAWRIRAENGSSQTAYFTRKITIDTTRDLGNQQFNVISPANDYFSNDLYVKFSWPVFPYADKYEYLLTDTNKNKIKSIVTTLDRYLDTLNEGWYYWSVRALNTSNSTATNYSVSRRIYIDVTPPAAPSLKLPFHNAFQPNPVILTWTNDEEAKQDSLLVALDSAFQNITYNVLLADSVSHTLPQLSINNSFFWKLKSKDAAGNWSEYSNVRRFSVTQ